MKNEEKAYIAGIIDGEGSIMLTRFHKNQHPSPCVSVASTDKELLVWLQETIGSGNITSKKNYNNKKHKDSYTYKVNYNDAIELLKDIIPYLVIPKKKARAQLNVTDYKNVTPRNGRYSKEMKQLKETFYEKFMSL